MVSLPANILPKTPRTNLENLDDNGFALGVRAGFQGTKLSTQHKSLIEKLNLNFTTSPRMTPNACYA
jgi:hypothetical protein